MYKIMKRNIFMASAAIVIIAGATVNVKLNDSSTKANLSLRKTISLSAPIPPGWRECYKAEYINQSQSVATSYQKCPASITQQCPGGISGNIRGTLTANAVEEICWY
jgi:hypothetical protein